VVAARELANDLLNGALAAQQEQQNKYAQWVEEEIARVQAEKLRQEEEAAAAAAAAEEEDE